MSSDDDIKDPEEEEEKESGTVSPDAIEDGLPEVEEDAEGLIEDDVVSLDKLREEEEEEEDSDYNAEEWN